MVSVSFATTGFYGFYFFIGITSIYFAVRYFIGDKLIIIVLYYLALLGGLYLINLSTTNSICGSYQYGTAAIVTFIPWIVIFGLLTIILKLAPGWLSPFSNTIGYLVAKLAGINNLFNKILVRNETGETQKLIENIYNDNSLLINQINTKNFDSFFNRMILVQIFQDGSEIYKESLRKLVRLKELVAEMTWYLLSGILISSITYNYILNSDCNKSQNISQLQEDFIKNSNDYLPSNLDKTTRLYTSTE
jgi:hypothetical protein